MNIFFSEIYEFPIHSVTMLCTSAFLQYNRSIPYYTTSILISTRQTA